MVQLVNRFNRGQHRQLLAAMHADRKRVFVDLLKWDVPHDGVLEQDEFDDADAVYLIVTARETGQHLGSARLLRTERPHILGDLFPQLCAGAPPRGPDIREITRFCLAPGIGRAARLDTRNKLVRGLVEYALMTGVRSYTGVAQIAWLSQILAAGWDVRPLGLPAAIAGTMLGAMEIRIAGNTLHRLEPAWSCAAGPLRIVEYDLPLAA